MKPNLIFTEFENIAKQLNIKIIKEKGNFKGGYCLLKEKKIIVLNKLKTDEQNIRSLSKVFAQFNISNIYIKPFVRKLIELENANKTN